MAISCIQVVVYTHSIYHCEDGFHHFLALCWILHFGNAFFRPSIWALVRSGLFWRYSDVNCFNSFKVLTSLILLPWRRSPNRCWCSASKESLPTFPALASAYNIPLIIPLEVVAIRIPYMRASRRIVSCSNNRFSLCLLRVRNECYQGQKQEKN